MLFWFLRERSRLSLDRTSWAGFAPRDRFEMTAPAGVSAPVGVLYFLALSGCFAFSSASLVIASSAHSSSAMFST